MNLCLNPHCPQPKNTDTVLFCQSCGSELLLDGRYRVISQLGSGGFGTTYEVIDCSLSDSEEVGNNLKVLKVLSHNHPKYVELFQREVQFLARFNHPGIPSVEPDAYFTYYPHQTLNPIHCLVMEKIDGLDLKEYIKRRGACISQKRAIKWLIQVTEILQEMHSHHFFHRDIKPSNIMLRSNGQLVLIDFGTAREVTDTYLAKQTSGQVTGLFSAGYSPPEQLNGQAVPQSDFFALGRTFIYLLTGKTPNDFYDSYIDEIRWHEATQDTINPEFSDFLDCMMSRLPKDRPKNGEEILQTLKQIYQTLYTGNKLRYQGSQNSSFLGTQTEKNTLNTDISGSFIPSSPVPPPLPDLTSSPPIINPTPKTTTPILDQAFVQRCQTLLSQLVGPVASILCQKTLQKNPHQSEQEFVEALAKKIPNPQQAQQFKLQIWS
ncbi:MAG: serine/threonine protein kinase [Microcystaceae cyanobacterium]